jgi:DNA-binding GntR family transcriptional regulator
MMHGQTRGARSDRGSPSTRTVRKTKRAPASTASDAAPSKSSPHKVYTGVLKGLYEGRFVPGQRLVESDLSRIYGVSRNSVREALNRLAAERIVSLNLHRGAHLRHLTRSEARDNLELIELMIGLAARLAASNLKRKKAAKRFSEVLDKLLSFEDRPDSLEFLGARNQFYRVLVEIGGNGELPRILPGMEVHLLRVQFRSFYPVPQKAGISDYRRIGEAVLAGDPKRAEMAGQAHVRRIAKEVADLPDEAFGLPDDEATDVESGA